MLKELADNGLLVGVGIAAAVSLGNYVTSLLTRRRVQADLETIRLQAQVAEFQRSQAVAIELEKAKAETAAEQKIIADALTQAQAAQQLVAATMNKKLDDLAIVSEATHAQTNGARTALERVELELRNQLKAQELAASNAEKAAIIALQTVKELAARDLQAEREKNAQLTQQLAAVAPPLSSGSPVPIPVEVVATTPVPVTVMDDAPGPQKP